MMKTFYIWLTITNIVSSSVLKRGEALSINVSPPECRRLKTDSDFPANAVWKAALPGVLLERRAKGKTSPDYRFRAKSIEDVQKAVKFADQSNVRLAIVSTGKLLPSHISFQLPLPMETEGLTETRPRLPDSK
jgi:hypothetical protein